jgi:hypothetical protein
MTNFEPFKELFLFLKVENYPWKHWLNSTS